MMANPRIHWIKTRIMIYGNIPYQMQRIIRWLPLRNFVYNMLLLTKPKSEKLNLSDKEQGLLKDLQTDGIAPLGQYLSSEKVQFLRQELDKLKCTDRFRPHLGDFAIDNHPAETHVADFKTEELLRIPLIMDLANDPEILKVAEAFMGCKPTISNIQSWWSLCGHDQPEQAEFFHRDVDDWRFFKFFIYLTDVDDNAGPHVFVKGSQGVHTGIPIRRYSDQEVIDLFGKENVMHIHATAGTAFLENTFGFHKGQLPKSKRRLLLQFQYSYGGIGIIDYKKVEISNYPYDKYVGRLYVA